MNPNKWKSIKHPNEYCKRIEGSMKEEDDELSKLLKELVVLIKSNVCPNAECKKIIKKVKEEMEAETDKLEKSHESLDHLYFENLELMILHSMATWKLE